MATRVIQRSYVRTVPLAAPIARAFAAVATPEGFGGWWTPLVSGSADFGGTLRLDFAGMDEHIDLRATTLATPSIAHWGVLIHSSLPEWAGTTLRFTFTPAGAGRCRLAFEHAGLTPRLVCYDDCRLGWDHFLTSLMAYVERGRGSPFGG